MEGKIASISHPEGIAVQKPPSSSNCSSATGERVCRVSWDLDVGENADVGDHVDSTVHEFSIHTKQ